MMASRNGSGEKVDASNWRSAPFNRWSFHNIEQIIDTQPIAGGSWTASALPPSDSAPRALLLNGLFLRTLGTDAVVARVDGRIVHEWYANGNARHSPHILMSATKAVMGLLAGILEAAGKLQTGALVSDYVPELIGTAYEGATLRHLLDMRAGVVLDDVRQRAYEDAINWDARSPSASGADLQTFFKSLKAPPAEHGGVFRYVSANTDLLGWAMERATGRKIAALLGEHLFGPMGAETAAHITLDRSGLARSSGGLCTTARDFARIGQLMVDAGQAGGRQVVPELLIGDIHGNGDADAWRNGEWGERFAAISRNIRYRSGWYVVDDDPQLLFAMGIHGQNLFIDRKRRLVVAKLSSWGKPIERLPLWFTHIAFGRLQQSVALPPPDIR